MYADINCVGFFDVMAVEDLFKECVKMMNLTHPNVLTLRGVCIDRGPVPYIILPYMANGSLLNYLKKNRTIFMLSDSSQVTNTSYNTFVTLAQNLCALYCIGICH